MSFLKGSVSYQRYQVLPFDGDDEAIVRELGTKAFGTQPVSGGVEVGWTAGDSILDTAFTLEKNVYPDFIHFEMTIAKDYVPGDLLKAYYVAELKALAAENSSGLPSARQKREARESARNRIEEEAKDGRWRKRKSYPVLWDRAANELYFGGPASQAERFLTLFHGTFNTEPQPITASVAADRVAPATANFSDATPSWGNPPCWCPDKSNLDWLGNEAVLWLWFRATTLHDMLKRLDGVREVILATNPTMEGEATALYIAELISQHFPNEEERPQVTRIGHGLPIGADIEYADGVTLARALEGRRSI
jgi:hypothetical protein